MYYRGIKNITYIEHEREMARERSRAKTGRTEDSPWYMGEKKALNILKGSVRAYGQKYDLEWNNLKIDVKTAQIRLVKTKYKGRTLDGSWGWSFVLDKQRGVVDYFLCIALGKNKEVLKVFLIPESEIKTNSISPGFYKSKYDKWLIKGNSLFGVR